MVVPNFRAGAVSRAQSSLAAAGGKGINVARAARTLGDEAFCTGFLGGTMGHYVAELAEREGIPGHWTWIEGETRTCAIVADADTGEATVINEQGPTVSSEDWRRLHEHVMQSVHNGADYVCFSGSLPLGSTTKDYLNIVHDVLQAGKPVWIDTSGEALRAVWKVAAIGIKVNGDEAGAILGKTVSDPQSALSAARELQHTGPHTVVLTLGAQGAVMAHPDGCWWAKPPALKVIDPIGSGDSFLAGLVTSLDADYSPEECLLRAAAAGAANALSVGGGHFPLTDFNQILAGTTLTNM
jgi:1-phosphofructokinase family hexose kinase